MNPLSNIKKFIHNTRQNDDQGTKNQRFLGNMVLSTALSAPLFLFAKDDKVAQQTAIQDIIINSNNLSRCLAESKEIRHLMEGIKETTVFSALVGVVLTPIAESLKSTTGDILGAISVPVMTYFMGPIIDKYFGEKKILPKERVPEEEKKKRAKTHIAVGLASVIKAGIYAYNVKMGNGHTSNAIFLSSLLNSLKTSVTTEQAFRKNETVREAKDVIGILFDGVASPIVTQSIIFLGQKANLSSGVGMVVAKSLVGSVIASGLLNGVTTILDNALEWGYNYQMPKWLGLKPSGHLETPK